MQGNPFEIREVKSATREVTRALTDILRAEIKLATTEIQAVAGNVGQHVTRLAIFGFIGALGTLPLMAFLVLGLGGLLGGNYLLSSLIVSLMFFAVGGGVAYHALSMIREADTDLTLPETRSSISEGLSIESQALAKIHPIQEISKRRQA